MQHDAAAPKMVSLLHQSFVGSKGITKIEESKHSCIPSLRLSRDLFAEVKFFDKIGSLPSNGAAVGHSETPKYSDQAFPLSCSRFQKQKILQNE